MAGDGPGLPAAGGLNRDGTSQAALGIAPGQVAGFGDGGGSGTSDSALVTYLLANRGDASWIVATWSANQAGSIELASGQPVMAMGGFSGGDPAPTLDQLKAYVASGQLRYVLVSGGGGMGGPGGNGASSSAISAWVASAGTVVDYGGSAGTLYDLSAASTASATTGAAAP
jgi:hypothetical protein